MKKNPTIIHESDARLFEQPETKPIYSIRPVRVRGRDQQTGRDDIAQCEPADATAWGLYVEIKGNGILPQHLRDFPTRAAAEKVLHALSSVPQLTKKKYSLCEAVADIACYAGLIKYYSGDSRADIAEFIKLAQSFEIVYRGRSWDDGQYIELIVEFAAAHLGDGKTDEQHWNDETQYEPRDRTRPSVDPRGYGVNP